MAVILFPKFLGNITAACDFPTLEELNIKYILTIDSVPLPRHITENEKFVTKYIQSKQFKKISTCKKSSIYLK